MKCNICEEEFDEANLWEVFEHEHKGLNLTEVIGINQGESKDILKIESLDTSLRVVNIFGEGRKKIRGYKRKLRNLLWKK